MIYFCADDYGIAESANSRIEECVRNGVLNKISVLPNGEISDLKRLVECGAKLALHINLVEGYPLSDSKDVNLLVTEEGSFKHSFVGLMKLSFSGKRKEFEKQLYHEIRCQVRFWKNHFGDEAVMIDSHQHTHAIPLIFKTLLRVIEDEKIDVEYLRFPSEPLTPFLMSPSLYFEYSLVGLAKQWLLKFFGAINKGRMKKSQISSAYFMGAVFSGALSKKRVKKLLVHYEKLATKHNKNIEIGFHPGFVNEGEKLMKGTKEDFGKFYYSPWRKAEYDTLINFGF